MVVNRLLVDIWMVKAILMRSQTEMRNMSLEIRGRVILSYEMAKSLAKLYSCPSVL